MTIYMQGYMELLICCILAIIGKGDFQDMNHSDRFALVFCYGSLVILILLPILVVYVLKSNSHNLQDPEF
jgi:hypothetical protein